MNLIMSGMSRINNKENIFLSIFKSICAVCVCGLLLSVGCAVQIGDACTGSQDCDNQTCDTTAPNGYCTSYQCTLNSCSEEAVCVDFEVTQACMLRCSENKDCRERDGYVCRHDYGGIGYCYVPSSSP